MKNVELVAITKPLIENLSTDDFTAYIARIGKVKENPERLIKFLIRHAHWSPFEHTFVTFKIYTSRAMGRELLRHRSFTFQELSQRYEKVPGFEPIALRAQSEKNRQSSTASCDPLLPDPFTQQPRPASECIAAFLAQAQRLYGELLDAGVARECARFVLPECTSTVLLMSGSVRSWIHFFAIRDHEAAQLEVRMVAQQMKTIFAQEFPSIATAIWESKKEPEQGVAAL